MSDVQEARRKLIQLRIKLGSSSPPLPPLVLPPLQKGSNVNQAFSEFIGAQVKRAVTLGIGVLVGAGYLSVSDGDAQGAALSAVLAQIVLSVAYAAYDKFVKEQLARVIARIPFGR